MAKGGKQKKRGKENRSRSKQKSKSEQFAIDAMKACQKLLGAEPGKMERPGGTSRTSVRMHIGDSTAKEAPLHREARCQMLYLQQNLITAFDRV